MLIWDIFKRRRKLDVDAWLRTLGIQHRDDLVRVLASLGVEATVQEIDALASLAEKLRAAHVVPLQVSPLISVPQASFQGTSERKTEKKPEPPPRPPEPLAAPKPAKKSKGKKTK